VQKCVARPGNAVSAAWIRGQGEIVVNKWRLIQKTILCPRSRKPFLRTCRSLKRAPLEEVVVPFVEVLR